MTFRHNVAFAAAAIAVIFTSATADACTRFVHEGADAHVLTARSMDWSKPIISNLWLFPRGMQREGAQADNAVRWTSRYGSVITSGYDLSTTDGINEKGLSAALLWLSESVYPINSKNKKVLMISAWAQYVLDNFATVREAVSALRRQEFIVVSDSFPEAGERLVTLHLALSDASGDSAVAEYIDGELVIHDTGARVLTNSPVFSEQVALSSYWNDVDGFKTLPGTSRSTDRFVRAKFYSEHIPDSLNTKETLASVFSVIRNTSAPYRISEDKNSPKNRAGNTGSKSGRTSTLWRTVHDHKHLRYYFESAVTPNAFWVDLNDMDFSAETGVVRKLDLGLDQVNIYSGNTADKFEPAEAFPFTDMSGNLDRDISRI